MATRISEKARHTRRSLRMPSLRSMVRRTLLGGECETVRDEVRPANPSNCLHCKTCQRKCPFDNIRWTAPEGNGPRYKRM